MSNEEVVGGKTKDEIKSIDLFVTERYWIAGGAWSNLPIRINKWACINVLDNFTINLTG